MSVIEKTPLKLLYLVSSMVSILLYPLAERTVGKVVKRNLRRAFPEKNNKDISRITLRYYRNIIDFLFEFIKQNSFSNKKMLSHIHYENIELLREITKNKKMIICYSGHFVNFEWLVTLPLYDSNFEMGHLYLSDESDNMTEYVLKTRSRYGAVNIPSKSPLKYLMMVRQSIMEEKYPFQGFIYGTLADMDPMTENQYVSEIFGHKIEMFTGSEKIGTKYDMAFVYASMSRINRGEYSVRFEQIIPEDKVVSSYPYTEKFVKMLEQNIRKQPDLWMFWAEPRF
ncbi:MAG: lysophospholipid acyltransferase family protein [Prevotella sp.]|nr:lysophospholipid acyltransferase family protein [Prevotella sp.]